MKRNRTKSASDARSALPAIEASNRVSSELKSILLIVLIGVLFLYPLWIHRGIVFSKHSDIIAEHLSIYTVGREAVASEGGFPLWNPSINGGLPAFANPQSMYLFPFDLLFFVLPIDVATNLVILLNVVLAGLAMYLFSRLFLGQMPAVFCSIAYMLSWRFVVMIYSGWLPKMSMYALVPLLFWSCEILLRRAAARQAAWFSVVVGLCLLQGDMQQFFYAGLGLILYVSARLLLTVKTGRKRVLLCLSGGALLGTMLAAPALLPRIEYAALSTRTEADFGFFLAQPPTLKDLKTVIDPFVEGGNRDEFWENNFYFGLWVFPLLAFAFRRERRRSAMLVCGAIAVMVFLCFNTPVLKFIFDFFPGFSLFRQSSRLLLLVQFLFVFACGVGVEALLARRLFAGDKSRLIAAAVVCVLPVLDSGIRLHPLLLVRPLSEAAPEHPIHRLLNRQGGRTAAIGRTSIPYGMAGYYGIDMVNGYSSLTLKHYIEYFSVLQSGSTDAIPHRAVVWTDLVGLARPDMFRALDVCYIVANSAVPLESVGYRKVADYDQVPVFVFYSGIQQLPITVWRDENPLGPAYFATSVARVANEAESLKAIASAKSVLDAKVLVLDTGLPPLDFSGGSVKLVRRGYNTYEYEIESSGENYLILSQVWYPGWRAKLDGAAVKVYRTNHALIGCCIPKGRHHFTLQMTSPMLRWGAIPAGIAATILVIMVIVIPLRSSSRRRK